MTGPRLFRSLTLQLATGQLHIAITIIYHFKCGSRNRKVDIRVGILTINCNLITQRMTIE